MGITKYKVVIAQSGKGDIQAMKKYIIENFKYRELAENFSRKMKNTMKKLDVFPEAHKPTDFEYRGYRIYLKLANSYLLFYVVNEKKKIITVLRVMQDGMNWKFIIKRWIGETS
jgi:Plasmid stabilisation system protein.